MKNGRNRTNRLFDLNRHRAQGIRQTINFNNTSQQNRYHRQWRQKQRLNIPSNEMSYRTTKVPSTAITDMMTTPTKTTTTMLSNDVNHHDEQNIENYDNKNVKQDFERKSHPNILNKTLYQTNDTKQIDQHELLSNEQATNRLAIQTNEIFDIVVTTTLSPREMKKRKLKNIRNHLNKLNPEAQSLFFKRRAERNKKRGITESNSTEP